MYGGRSYYCLRRFRNITLLRSSAFVWSNDARIEVKEPETSEKMKTPVIIKTIQKTYSGNVPADMSPYPTVVMVVTIKYTA